SPAIAQPRPRCRRSGGASEAERVLGRTGVASTLSTFGSTPTRSTRFTDSSPCRHARGAAPSPLSHGGHMLAGNGAGEVPSPSPSVCALCFRARSGLDDLRAGRSRERELARGHLFVH